MAAATLGAIHRTTVGLRDWAGKPNSNLRLRRTAAISLLFCLTLAIQPLFSQTIDGTVPVQSIPKAAGIDPTTNKIYVVTQGGSPNGTVTIIDGATHTTKSVSTEVFPVAMAVDSALHKIYVAALGNGTNSYLTIVNQNADSTGVPTSTTVFDFNGNGAHAVAVDPVSNLVFVANDSSNLSNGAANISVWSTSTDGYVSTIPVDGLQSFMAIDTAHSILYTSGVVLTAPGNTGITKIPEADKFQHNPQFSQVFVPEPGELVVDEGTNTIFVTALGEDPNSLSPLYQVYAINATTLAVNRIITLGSPGNSLKPMTLSLNPATHKVYVGWQAGITIIDGSNTNYSNTTITMSEPSALVVNSLTNRVFAITNSFTGPPASLSVIDGVSGLVISAMSITGTGVPSDLEVAALNPITNRLYLTSDESGQPNNVVDIDLSAESLSSIADNSSTSPNAITVNPATHKIYVASAGANIFGTVPDAVTVIDPNQNNLVKTITPPNAATPFAIAADPVTNTIYVVNKDSSNVTVIDGDTDTYEGTITDPAASDPLAVIVNPVNDKIYVANNGSGNVTIIDGGSKTILKTVPAGPVPFALAVNNFVTNTGQVFHKIYVVNNIASGGTVTEIDGDTDSVTNTIPAGGFPFAIAVNPVSNHVWVANDGTNNITMFDAETHQTVLIADPSATHPRFITVDPISDGLSVFGKVYVANQGTKNVTIISDAFGDPFVTMPVGNIPTGIGVNPNTNHVFVANYLDGTISVIDGSSNTVNTITDSLASLVLGLDLNAIAVDPSLNEVYVNGSANGTNPFHTNVTVTSINEEQNLPTPLQTIIGHLPDNETFGTPVYAQLGFDSTLQPTFDLSGNSSFNPFAPPIEETFFQVDSWQGRWFTASGVSKDLFSAMPPGLQPGYHTLYAFATDGREASSSTSGVITQFGFTSFTHSTGTFEGNITAYPFIAGSAPEVTSLMPTAGAIGTLVTVAGHGFGGTQGSSTVTFNGTDAGLAATWTETLITINVPSGATTGPVIVTVGGIASNRVLFTVKPTADLSLTKTASPEPVPSGQNITYTLMVTNNGPNDATGVTLVDTFPPAASASSYTASQGTCTGGVPSATCNLGTISAGSTATVTFTVSPPPGPGTITNNATVSASEFDPNPANNTASVTSTLLAPPVTVTVTTSPLGPSFTVDGVTYNSPQTLTWGQGSTHSIGTSTLQTNNVGTLFNFAGWSDGGAATHSVTAPASTTTYTATFNVAVPITNQVSETASGLLFNRVTHTFSGTLTITNNGAAISGPIQVLFQNLTSGVTLVNASGSYQGGPFITVLNGLAPGQSVQVPVQLLDPSLVAPHFTLAVYSGVL
jgi:YVTN family beta-propeller protein